MNDLVISEEEAFGDLALLGDELAKDAGAGSENVTADDIAIPYLSILQKMSPQVDEDHVKHIDGAKSGMVYQNLNELFWMVRDNAPSETKETLLVVNFAYERKILEWVPREAGGGLVDVHEWPNPELIDSATKDEKNRLILPNGNIVVDTATHYVMYESPITKTWEPAVISMKSTALKKSRLWNSLISQQMLPGTETTAPRWLFKWKLETTLETKGDDSWFNWEITRDTYVSAALYKKAKKMHSAFREGKVVPAADGEEIPF